MIKVEINLSAIRRNILKMKAKLKPGTKFCPVLKANGYRFGDDKVAPAIEDIVDYFGCFHITELERLRNAGITKPILLLGVCEDFGRAIKNKATITITSVFEAKALAKFAGENKLNCPIHIEVDTGMERFGIATIDELKEILDIAGKSKFIDITGLFTHFAYATTENKDMVDAQIRAFKPFATMLKKKYQNAIIHAASSGTAEYSDAQFDMVRGGFFIYGSLVDGYENCLKATSNIVAIRHVKAGTKIGYSGTKTVDKDTTIGLVAAGYADVINFKLFATAPLFVNDKPCYVLGRICMDSCMIDVSHIKDPLGKTVTVYDNKPSMTLLDRGNENGHTGSLILALDFNRADVTYITDK
ncbi:MAG: alanine racemase [Firmicutes bacterium]|nr:alanine racemase [Bacillota bacterium]